MKAIVIHEFGGPEVLRFEDFPKPKPAADEVLIKIYASGVNPVDWKIREGLRKERFPVNLPLIPGWDVSGIVEETGSNVTDFKNGDEVYSRPDPTKNGSYAEYVVVKANQVAMKPKSIDHIKAAAVPLAGLTAWQALFQYGKLEKGQKILIHAASGGVGTYAVQFAKWNGAYVVATTSSVNAELVKQLGADEIIDYTKEKFETRVQDVDLVVDTLGGEVQKTSLLVLKHGGRLITTLKAEFMDEAKKKNIHLEDFIAQSYPKDLIDIATLIDQGNMQPVIALVLPLEKAAEAQLKSKEAHAAGKIVLQVI